MPGEAERPDVKVRIEGDVDKTAKLRECARPRDVRRTIMGTAANLLPIPGAAVVRLANLNKGGVKIGRGVHLTAIIGMAAIGFVMLPETKTASLIEED